MHTGTKSSSWLTSSILQRQTSQLTMTQLPCVFPEPQQHRLPNGTAYETIAQLMGKGKEDGWSIFWCWEGFRSSELQGAFYVVVVSWEHVWRAGCLIWKWIIHIKDTKSRSLFPEWNFRTKVWRWGEHLKAGLSWPGTQVHHSLALYLWDATAQKLGKGI